MTELLYITLKSHGICLLDFVRVKQNRHKISILYIEERPILSLISIDFATFERCGLIEYWNQSHQFSFLVADKVRGEIRMNNARLIKGVIFDMDGTLCLPQQWMFPAMRSAIGLKDNSMDILTFIDRMPSISQREKAHSLIEEVEYKAMQQMVPQNGLVELLSYLTQHNIKKSICTRNVIKPVNSLLQRFVPEEFAKFDAIITREFRPAKPFPDPLFHISKLTDIPPSMLMMIGDSYDDMKSGRDAGCTTVLLSNQYNGHLRENNKDLLDFVVHELTDIIDILSNINNAQNNYNKV